MLPLITAGVGISMAIPTVPITALNAVPPADMGKASGIQDTLQRFGAAIVAAVSAQAGTWARRPDGKVPMRDLFEILHTYTTHSRGLDPINSGYRLLDLTPEARDEEDLPWSMAWVRRHDAYWSRNRWLAAGARALPAVPDRGWRLFRRLLLPLVEWVISSARVILADIRRERLRGLLATPPPLRRAGK